MSTLKSDNLEGSGGNVRNGKPAILLQGQAQLNITAGTLEVDANSQFIIPQGTEGQRPSSPSGGQVRVSQSSGALEGYDGTDWISLTTASSDGGGGIAGTAQDNPAESCYSMKNDSGVTQDGFYWINSSGSSTLTYCFMTAPWGEPDYYIFTPWSGTWGSDQYTRDHGWYHVDNAGQGNMGAVQYAYGPGYDYFDFRCDYCSECRRTYRYDVPAGHVVHWYGARSHCGGDRTFGYPGMTNSCSNQYSSYACNQVFDFTGNNTTQIGFRQRNDNCGDPNEATIVGVSKVSGTTRTAPNISEWKKYFRDVSWNNGGVNDQNG